MSWAWALAVAAVCAPAFAATDIFYVGGTVVHKSPAGEDFSASILKYIQSVSSEAISEKAKFTIAISGTAACHSGDRLESRIRTISQSSFELRACTA
jgi:hypothetical protein